MSEDWRGEHLIRRRPPPDPVELAAMTRAAGALERRQVQALSVAAATGLTRGETHRLTGVDMLRVYRLAGKYKIRFVDGRSVMTRRRV